MKGLLKGLRYISQIFDNKEEEEMQIGYPTDVKHVAHIGWDDNSSSPPSWMNEFRPGTANGGDTAVGHQQIAAGGVVDHRDSTTRDLPLAPTSRSSHRSNSTAGDGHGDPIASSANRETRPSGRHQLMSGTADCSATPDMPLEASRHVRRHRSNVCSVTGSAESTDGTKQSRRRRSKNASSTTGGDAKGSTKATSQLKPQSSSAELASEEQT